MTNITYGLIGYAGLTLSGLGIGLCLERIYSRWKEYREEKRIRTKSKLRILEGGWIGGK